MALIVFLLFLLFPVAEIMVMAKVASRIGFWDMLILLLFSAFVGGYLAKIQGRIALMRVQQAMAEGRAPSAEMLDGLLIFVGGILFIIPGFISDAIALFLVFPLTRAVIRWIILGNVRSGGRPQASRPAPQARPRQGFGPHKGDVQDAEIIE